jgi:hypothetical protein
MGEIAGSNPQLQTSFAAAITGIAGNYQDRMLNGGIEEAQRLLKEASVKELIDARVAFSELVAVMTGESKLARTYEEVTQDQKDVQISNALMGAYQSHIELQRTEEPTRWNRAAWKQNFEVPAEAINRRAAVDKDFALSTSRFLSSDIMMDLGNLRDAAAPNGVNISISDNGQVVVSSTDQAPPLRGAGVGVARRPITPGDKLNSFVTETKALIDDINSKMTVLGRLGETGSSTLDILRAEVPSATVGAGAGNDELGGGAVNDTLRGAGSGSTGTFGVVSVVNAGKGFTDVRKEDGTVERREGTRAWRNNNPGNIEYGDFAKKNGAVGTDGRFAVFPSYEQGREAKKKLLWETRGYSGLTIAGAINRYAPPSENDTGSYVNSVASSIGVGPDTPMAELNDSQKEVMLDAMERVEGFKTGSVNGVQAPAQATRARPSDGNAVASASGPAVQRAVNNAPSASSTMAATTPAPAPTVAPQAAPMEATAALPEAIPANAAPTGGTQGASELSPAIASDPDVQAFIQEIAGDPDKTYASEAEFVAAQEAGELEAGDTVVVNGEIYVVRKNGSVRRLGTVNS